MTPNIPDNTDPDHSANSDQGERKPNDPNYESNTQPDRLYEQLVKYTEANLGVIPVNPDKSAAVKWMRFMTEIVSHEELEIWCSSFCYFALVCGMISGSLEVIDIDPKNDPQGTMADDYLSHLKAEYAEVLSQLVIAKSPNGIHLFYRCSEISHSRVLARSELGKTIIETRGERSYILVEPSPGYSVTQGSLLDIRSITPDQREDLHSLACSLNRFMRSDTASHHVSVPNERLTNGRKLPGDDYNERSDVQQLLLDNGWRIHSTRNNATLFTRPGKQSGVSAILHLDAKRYFYVYTTNALPFIAGITYQPFAVFAMLQCNGDFKLASKQLLESGYGTPIKSPSESSDQLRVAATLTKVKRALDEHYQLRYNVVTSNIEVLELSVGIEWMSMTDTLFHSIYNRIVEHVSCRLDQLKVVIESDFIPDYHPLKVYFESLATTDGHDYIADLVASLEVIDFHQDVADLYIRTWLVGSVAQAVDSKPNHLMLVLVGRQGIGKTSCFRWLCPLPLLKYLYIGELDPTSKDGKIVITENFLIVCDDFDGMMKRDMKQFKVLLTQENVPIRKPYARYAEKYLRYGSFGATANQNTFLNDMTGNRRFLTLEVLRILLDNFPDLDKLWSQAYALYRAGFKYWFDSETIALVDSKNTPYVDPSMEDELVAAFVVEPSSETDAEYLTTTQVAERIRSQSNGSFQVNPAMLTRLGAALKKAGFPKDYNHKNRKVYRLRVEKPPEESIPDWTRRHHGLN